MRNKVRPCLVLIILLFIHFITEAQMSKFELQEFVKLAETYKRTPNLSFSLDYTYADSSTPTTYIEQMSGETKISNGHYWTWLDSVEFVQGSQYYVVIQHRDSILTVNNQIEYGDLLKLPILDSLFRSVNVDTMTFANLSGVYQITVWFKPGTAYNRYKVQYDPETYRISKIEYYLNAPFTDADSGRAIVTLAISSYSTAAVDQTLFRDDKFVYKQNGQLYAKPAFSGFQLIDNSNH